LRSEQLRDRAPARPAALDGRRGVAPRRPVHGACIAVYPCRRCLL